MSFDHHNNKVVAKMLKKSALLLFITINSNHLQQFSINNASHFLPSTYIMVYKKHGIIYKILLLV